MAFSSTIQPAANKATETPLSHSGAAPLLGMLLLSVYAAQKGNKSFRKLRRRFMWTALKLKAKSMFSKKKANISDRTLLYILLGILALILLFTYPLIALVLAVVVLILIVAGVI